MINDALWSKVLAGGSLLLLDIIEMESSVSIVYTGWFGTLSTGRPLGPYVGNFASSPIPTDLRCFLIRPLVGSSGSRQRVSWRSSESLPGWHLYIRKARNNFTAHRKDSTSQTYPMKPKLRPSYLKVLLPKGTIAPGPTLMPFDSPVGEMEEKAEWYFIVFLTHCG